MLFGMKIEDLRESVLSKQKPTTKSFKIQAFIDTLDDETVALLHEMLMDTSLYETRALWKSLKENGLDAGETTFRVFRDDYRSAHSV